MRRLAVSVLVAGLWCGVGAVERIPLIEEFTSSTCPPCASFNINVLNPFLAKEDLHGTYTCISYRMNWPGNGDPYFNRDGQTRRYYYDVGGVPDCYLDAANPNGSSVTSLTNAVKAAATVPAKAAMTVTYQLSGQSLQSASIDVTVSATPTASIANAKLYIAVLEKMTTGNKASNGETEFHHVMMKMLPNGGGQPIALSAGQQVSIDAQASLAGTFIEELSDLEVVAWIQVDGSQEVIQSAWGSEEVISGVLANDDRGLAGPSLSFRLEAKRCEFRNAANASVRVFDLAGRCVRQVKSLPASGSLDLQQLPRGLYVVSLTRSGTSLSRRIAVSH